MNAVPVKKLLFGKMRKGQLILSVIGTAMGLFIMMTGVMMWQDVRRILTDKDMLGDDYIVISKKISLLNTLSGGPGRFSEEDIAELKALKAIDGIGAFTPGKFKVSMELSADYGKLSGQLLKTDMFLEAVPDGFIDIEQDEWQWKPGRGLVPIVIPADIIKQYNHAFAASQNLPVIPEAMLKKVKFSLRIGEGEKTEVLEGRIAGFSNRINSILVPQSFLDYGNKNYSEGTANKPSRLILHAKDPTAPELMQFFRNKGYELNEEKLKASRTNALLQIIMLCVALLGVFIVLLALLGFIQYTQLLAYRSAYEIQTLHWIGYRTSELNKPYTRFSLINLAIAFGMAGVFLVSAHWKISSILAERGFDIALQGWKIAIPVGFLMACTMFFISFVAVKKQVETLAR
jgi:hypothetical protein